MSAAHPPSTSPLSGVQGNAPDVPDFTKAITTKRNFKLLVSVLIATVVILGGLALLFFAR